MQVRKGVLLFAVSILLTACFNPPEFSVVPQIEFVGIHFEKATMDEPTESLILTISFKDGDGDLGLSPDEIDDPYQDVFYALADNGNITDVSKETLSPRLPQFVKIPPGSTGKLITARTLQDPLYAGKLPPFINEQKSCKDYPRQTIYVSETDAERILDSTFPNIETVSSPDIPKYYKVNDLFYKRNNPKHVNIEVEFYVKQAGGDYTLFDWEKENCESSFSQRFPVLSDKKGPLEGTLTYAMTSIGIKATFNINTLRLRVRIRDKAFNISNTVETGDFTLD